MSKPSIPDLTFPGIEFGAIETKWDLSPLLYRGGAGTYIRHVADRVAQGSLGAPIKDRIPLVVRLHEYLAGKLAAGTGRASIKWSIAMLRTFFAWIDTAGRLATLDTIEQTYIDYSEHLLHRVRVVGDMSEVNAYACATSLSGMLNEVLQLTIGVFAKTRLTKPRTKKRVLGTHADKQNLEQMAVFGHCMLDITNALSLESIRGHLPVIIRFGTGQVLEEWCGLTPTSRLKTLSYKESCKKRVLRQRAAWEADTSSRTRHPLINLRIEAELLIFVAQTGMNLAQAKEVRAGRFRYQSHLDGYKVYGYKGRRGGEVKFDIYSEYRPVFERYLHWREAMFPANEDDRLFPSVCVRGAKQRQWDFKAVQKKCQQLGIRCFRPRALRKARVNWLLRRSRDPHLAAEMNQHTQETLLRIYDQPHHQVAAAEITRFLMATDPAIAVAAPGPGVCADTAPRPEPAAPPHAPKPDCVSPAGCLFCDQHRDLDTKDHMWSLATYRHFKSVELMQYRPPTKGHAAHPAAAAIDRVTEKLKHFEGSSDVRALWVQEAVARVHEGHYHPKWDGFIQLMELGT